MIQSPNISSLRLLLILALASTGVCLALIWPSYFLAIGGIVIAFAISWVAVRNRTLFPYIIVLIIGLDNVVVSKGSLISTIARPAMAFVLIMYLLKEIFEKNSKLEFPKAILVVQAALFVIYSGFTSIWSLNTELAISQTISLVQLLILMWLCGHFIKSPDDLQHFIRAWVMFSLAMTIVSLNMFWSTPLEYRSGTYVRAFALNQSPNLIATYIAIGLGALIGLRQNSKSNCYPFRRFVQFVPIFSFLVIGLIVTASRGGIIVFLTLSVMGISLLLVRNPSKGIVIILAIAVSAIMLANVFPDIVNNFLLRFQREGYNDPTGSRLQYAKVAWDIFLSYPVFGAGLASFPVYNRLATGGANEAHNTFATALSEGGMVGAGLLVLLVSTALLAVVRTIRQAKDGEKENMRPLSWSILFMLIGMILAGFSGDTVLLKPFWVILGLAQATYKLSALPSLSIGPNYVRPTRPTYQPLRIKHVGRFN